MWFIPTFYLQTVWTKPGCPWQLTNIFYICSHLNEVIINIREMVLRWKRRDVILLFSSCFACREEARMMGSVYDVANYMTHELFISVFQIWFNVYLLTSLHDAIWFMNIHEQNHPWFLAMRLLVGFVLLDL
jgi:hypothetical protein